MEKQNGNEEKDALELLEADHKKVKGLFKEFEEAEEDDKDVKRIVEDALQELRVHAMVEEEIFYPAAAGTIKDEEGLVEEAKEEHHVVKTLITELEKMSGDEENYCAKFTVLVENVRHHIKEEEGGLFPKIKKSDLDLEELGRTMAARKTELQEEKIPVGAGAHAAPSRSVQGGRGPKKSRS